ncbi:MAG: hypothetical protein ACNS62_08820 [Candidatus Cyclobacteriaceae bacterium M3_2C_046]
MSREEKIKKAVAIAVAYFVEQEKATLWAEKANRTQNNWMQASKTIQMNMQQMIHQRASIARPRSLYNREESLVLN